MNKTIAYTSLKSTKKINTLLLSKLKVVEKKLFMILDKILFPFPIFLLLRMGEKEI
jgi:hypothetical protein